MGKDKQSKTDFCSVVYFQKSVNKKAEITEARNKTDADMS